MECLTILTFVEISNKVSVEEKLKTWSLSTSEMIYLTNCHVVIFVQHREERTGKRQNKKFVQTFTKYWGNLHIRGSSKYLRIMYKWVVKKGFSLGDLLTIQPTLSLPLHSPTPVLVRNVDDRLSLIFKEIPRLFLIMMKILREDQKSWTPLIRIQQKFLFFVCNSQNQEKTEIV